MTVKVFFHYDDAGNVLGMTQEHEMFFEQRLADGEKIIEIPTEVDYTLYKVDLTTLTVVKKTDEEIKAHVESYFTPQQYTTQEHLHNNIPAVFEIPPPPDDPPVPAETPQGE